MPSFHEVSNTTLFNNIMNHKLAPGPTYETCHHGISILAVSLWTFSVQEHEQQEESYFNLATHKTPDAIKKHLMKGLPPLPTTISELIQQLHQLLVLTEGLFTHRCSMADQLHDLMEAFQVRERHLMGDYTSSIQLIPQVVWALTLTACNFFGQVCMHSQLDPATRAPCAGAAKATLSTYTHMITMKMCLDLDSLPMQWTPQVHHTQVQDHTSTAKPAAPKSNKQSSNTMQPAQTPQNTYTIQTNPHWPPIFVNNDTIKQLLTKWGKILMQIFMEAGIQGSSNCLNLTGLPNNLCLHWLILGRCGGGHGQECN